MIPVLFISIILVLIACGESNSSESKNKETKDMKELVNDYSTGKIEDESASITSTELIVTNSNEKKTSYDITEEEFFVSIAPYVNETHPCTDHSLTGCQGELVDKDFDILIKDMDGNIVMEEIMNSGANGFIDLWLPRNQTYEVQFSYDGKQVESEISTFKEDQTCITTMQLS